MKNKLIIFSKNRACQLHLLLESIQRNAPLFFDEIVILYTATDLYEGGYTILRAHFPESTVSGISYVQEKHFKDDLLALLDEERFPFTTLLVDDAIFYRPVTTKKETALRAITDDVVCFSLRLGINCTYSHPVDISYSLGEHEVVGDFLKFDYRKQMKGDFSFPLSTDGHIYRTTLLKSLLERIEFADPNWLEFRLQNLTSGSEIPRMIASFKESRVVSVPVNAVNIHLEHKYGMDFFISAKALNKRYVGGEVIDLTALDFSKVNGPHREINFSYRKL
jgi:hypothetical protein